MSILHLYKNGYFSSRGSFDYHLESWIEVDPQHCLSVSNRERLVFQDLHARNGLQVKELSTARAAASATHAAQSTTADTVVL